MLAHRLRHRVTFQVLSGPARDGDNVIIPGAGGWQTATMLDGKPLTDVAAEVLTGPGKEWRGSAATQADTTARITLRWFPANDIAMASWRVLWDGRIYNIQSVDTDATARREWRLRCVNGPTEGQ